MARPRIGERAMTAAERARRYRERHRGQSSVDRAAHQADAALWQLWRAVLNAGPSVDDTEPIRAEIDRAREIVRAVTPALRTLDRV